MTEEQEKEFDECMEVLQKIDLTEDCSPRNELDFESAYKRAIYILMDAEDMTYAEAAKRLFIVCKG